MNIKKILLLSTVFLFGMQNNYLFSMLAAPVAVLKLKQLSDAAERGCPEDEVLELLREVVPSVDLATRLLHSAAMHGRVEVARYLLDTCRVAVDIKEGGLTPLHRAAVWGHAEVCVLLLDRGAQIDARGTNNWTPLHCAAWHTNASVVALLVDRGANRNLRVIAGYNRGVLTADQMTNDDEIKELILTGS